MSRFFRAAGDSDSDSSDESDESLISEDEAPAAAKPAATGMARFLRTAAGSDDSSSEDEDESDSDEDSDGDGESGDSEDERGQRILSAQEKRLLEMEATGKAMDNGLKINDWVAISSEFDKLLRLVQRQHNVSEPIPPFYIKTLISLESSVGDALAKDKEKKRMNATNAKALTAMKQKIKKAVKEYEVQIKEYQKDPAAFESKYLQSVAPPEPAAKQPARQRETQDIDEEGFTPIGGKKLQFTPETILKTLQAVHEARGKKNTDRAEQIRILEKLLEVVSTRYQRLRVLLALISSRFDYNSSISNSMPAELWLAAQKEVDMLISIVATDSSYSIQEQTEDYDDLAERKPSDQEDGVVHIRGSIISFVDRLDDEFTKSLQNIDPHGTEYVDRLKDEKVLYCTICRAQAFYVSKNQEGPVTRVIMRRIEHIYSKPDAIIQALEAAVEECDIKPQLTLTLASQGSASALIHTLCARLYNSSNSLLRTRAMLSHVYHHALLNDYHTARDMLLMSHLQDSIHSADVATQILFNRTIVQLGLSAFRNGLIKEAQATLLDIFTTQRVKELLAQGVHQQRYQVLTPDQEKAEKQRQLPFHMHINTEMLEAAFLVSSMLVEIPVLASIESEEHVRKVISKPFRRLLDFADRQVFTGPPESTRDHIMQASKALQEGDWQHCRDLILGIKVWSLMPDPESVKEIIAKRIQEQGLRTYLFTYAPHYTTLSLSMLSQTFSLPLRTVTSIVSKMIWNEELSASLDQSAGVIIFHRLDLTRTQQLAQSLAEKVNAMVETNEKTLDFKMGGSGTGAAWAGDRGKGDDRGAAGQVPERRGNRSAGARRGGGGGGGGGQRSRFSQGLGNHMPPQQRAS